MKSNRSTRATILASNAKHFYTNVSCMPARRVRLLIEFSQLRTHRSVYFSFLIVFVNHEHRKLQSRPSYLSLTRNFLFIFIKIYLFYNFLYIFKFILARCIQQICTLPSCVYVSYVKYKTFVFFFINESGNVFNSLKIK